MQVSPPLGWKFTPEEVSITVDGETDACSQNRDVNFVFAGFGVVGQVVAAGDTRGPAGVDIELLSGDGQEVVQKTVTVKDGRYVFTAVAGADHKVRANHPVWQFDKAVGEVVITGDNGAAEELVVAGFDVRGKVVAGNQPIAGVSVMLYGTNAVPRCADNAAADTTGPAGTAQRCRAVTDAAGEFVFPVVPGGSYTLVPFYRGEHTQFEVSPAQIDFKVELDSVLLSQPFVVEGFSVKGKVLTGVNGQPLAAAAVTLNGAKVHSTTTNQDGEYFIDKIETGTYTISVTAEGVEFVDVTAAVSPSSPVLPAMTAARFLVSGVLDFSTVSPDSGRRVQLRSPGRPDLVVPVESTGRFSALVTPAVYTVSVLSSPADAQMGIVFAPLSLDIIVKTAPVPGLYFSPVRVSISGSVACSGPCPDLKVTLRPDGGSGEELVQPVEAGRFSFQHQLPGRYTVAVQEAGLCWDQPQIVFNIEAESVEDLKFVQTGWIMEVHSSHQTSLKYRTADSQLTGT